ncbi:MAG: transcription factor S [Candidatus Pacearchaeota archaeon]
MQFCPKCGAMLVLKQKNYGCPRCNYSSKDKVSLKVKEKFEEKQEMSVIKDNDVDILPTVAAECKKCGNKEAYFWTSQTRGSDETETRFFRCKKCNYTWREYK